jgi:hypothetical protein
MATTMISLDVDDVMRAISMIDIGARLCLYPISMYMEVASIRDRVISNEMYLYDLISLQRLVDALLDHDEISIDLKMDIAKFGLFLDILISHHGMIKKSCGMQFSLFS